MAKFLIRYGEIALKSSWVRKRFQARLVTNMQDYFLHRSVQCMIRSEYGRIFLDTDEIPAASEILGRIFGITSFSIVESTTSGLEDIAKVATEQFRSELKPGRSFAIRARRSGNQKYTSPELASFVGGEIQSSVEGLTVNLGNPDVEIFIEVRGKEAYVFGGRIPGPGGMPLGTQGTVLAVVSDKECIAGAWLMMKRGCKVHIAHFNKRDVVEPLRSWDVHLRTYCISDESELDSLIEEAGAMGFVTTWREGSRYEPAKKIPVFYPTIGLARNELDDLLRRIERQPISSCDRGLS
ncbi:MAG: THUMP domain-containing protein [Thermoplasmata archaeon]